MSQVISELPKIQTFIRVAEKNGKPAILVSKWITEPEDIKRVIHYANDNIPLINILTISDKFKLYSSMAHYKMIKYNNDNNSYEWCI